MSEQRHASLGIHIQKAAGARHIRRTRLLRRVTLAALVLLLLLLAGGLATLAVRQGQSRALAESAENQQRLHVLSVRPSPGQNSQSVALPGTLQGYTEAPISARTSGYLVRWHRDIGSRVKKGDILAEISTPEVDQQLAQAVAARPQALSTLELARVSMQRWDKLLRDKAVSQQEYDERRSAFVQAEANLAASDANIRRLEELESFKRVLAPFSGIVTRRNVNVGDLIEAGGGASARPLFVLSQPDPLRVYVYVPQAYAQQVKAGDSVSITQAELPGKRFQGKVVRTAGAIDTANRSLQTEISLPNPDGILLPGAYVTVALAMQGNAPLTIPTNALLLRAEGPQVAVIDPNGRVQLRPVQLGQDFGLQVQILDGIAATDELVLNPPDSLANGDVVTVSRPNGAHLQ
ncbi:efflux RND transporter periplasmic adaptor subunit [Oxalobacteraceae bacterium OM1]|nr:efflux RND transporter periplasmic adaptor subunit [Oxalobacteraceae bacterium OM1]